MVNFMDRDRGINCRKDMNNNVRWTMYEGDGIVDRDAALLRAVTLP